MRKGGSTTRKWSGKDYIQVPCSFSFRMKDTHDTKDIMAGFSIDRKIKITADIRKKSRVRRSADGGQVDLHLDAADIPEIAGIDQPFSSFTITF